MKKLKDLESVIGVSERKITNGGSVTRDGRAEWTSLEVVYVVLCDLVLRHRHSARTRN